MICISVYKNLCVLGDIGYVHAINRLLSLEELKICHMTTCFAHLCANKKNRKGGGGQLEKVYNLLMNGEEHIFVVF